MEAVVFIYRDGFTFYLFQSVPELSGGRIGLSL
jgi:hypothetical protein